METDEGEEGRGAGCVSGAVGAQDAVQLRAAHDVQSPSPEKENDFLESDRQGGRTSMYPPHSSTAPAQPSSLRRSTSVDSSGG